MTASARKAYSTAVTTNQFTPSAAHVIGHRPRSHITIQTKGAGTTARSGIRAMSRTSVRRAMPKC